MAQLPYIVYGTITDSNGSAVSGATVWLRNETTNEKIYTSTDSNGKYELDAANLASGYLDSDYFTIYCNNANEYNEASYLFSAGTHSVSLTLAAITDSDLIYYCTVQDVWDELGNKTSSDVSAKRVVKAIQRAESVIEEETRMAWRSVTVTDEYYDFNQYTGWKSAEQIGSINQIDRHDHYNAAFNDSIKLTHKPIVSVTYLYTNSAGESSADSWTLRTEQSGSAGDFIIYKSEGVIRFVNNYPEYGKRKMKITYVYGHSTVPKAVEHLTILLAKSFILRSKMDEDGFDGISGISVDGLSINSGREAVLKNLQEDIERAWRSVGTFNSHII